MITVKEIQNEIRKAINRHLVMHVQVAGDDRRDRIEILTEEAAIEIIKLQNEKK